MSVTVVSVIVGSSGNSSVVFVGSVVFVMFCVKCSGCTTVEWSQNIRLLVHGPLALVCICSDA